MGNPSLEEKRRELDDDQTDFQDYKDKDSGEAIAPLTAEIKRMFADATKALKRVNYICSQRY